MDPPWSIRIHHWDCQFRYHSLASGCTHGIWCDTLPRRALWSTRIHQVDPPWSIRIHHWDCQFRYHSLAGGCTHGIWCDTLPHRGLCHCLMPDYARRCRTSTLIMVPINFCRNSDPFKKILAKNVWNSITPISWVLLNIKHYNFKPIYKFSKFGTKVSPP